MAGSDSRPLHFVMQLNDAVWKMLYTEQAERHLTAPRYKEGYAFPDEGWRHGDDELVNSVLVQEGSDDLASAHHPDVLASLRADTLGKSADRIGDEVDAGGHGSGRRPSREHIVHSIRAEARAHLQTPVEGLAAEYLGIDGTLEFREAVEALWSRPFRQPIEIAIGSSHVAVRARRNIHDDLSLWHENPHVSGHGHMANSLSAPRNNASSRHRRSGRTPSDHSLSHRCLTPRIQAESDALSFREC